MKKLTPFLASLCVLAAPAFAGSFGPGPWASGAYYPGQMDGVYSASLFGEGGLTGIMGFALKNGGPTTSSNTTTTTGGGILVGATTQTTITVNPFQNYFIVYADGLTFAGVATANLNMHSKQVTGALYNGTAASSQEILASTNVQISSTGGTVVTNTTVSFTNVLYENTCGGAFTATIDSFNALTTFKGTDSGELSTAQNGVPVSAYTFSVNGIKVSSTPDASSATQ